MSKRNYTNYSKKNENLEQEVVETVDVKMEPETEIVEAVPEVVSTVAPVVEAVPEIPAIGVVTNCTKLNVRIKPEPGAQIVTVIDAGTQVEINVEKSTAEWYKVLVPSVNEGYCMRKFINADL